MLFPTVPVPVCIAHSAPGFPSVDFFQVRLKHREDSRTEGVWSYIEEGK